MSDMMQMNPSTKQKQTHRHREQTCGCQGKLGEGWTVRLGFADANRFIQNGWAPRSYWIAQELYSISVIKPNWKEFFKEYIYVYHFAIWQKLTQYCKATMKWSEFAQSCPSLWDPIDCSLPGSSVHGIFQARILEWVAISFSNNSSV